MKIRVFKPLKRLKRLKPLKPLNVIAQVAKLVDALCSGRSVRKDVLVRIQSWAPRAPTKVGALGFLVKKTFGILKYSPLTLYQFLFLSLIKKGRG